MFAPVIGAAYTMTTKREAHWSEQTKAQNTEKGIYVGLKQPRGDGERYVTPARAAAKETMEKTDCRELLEVHRNVIDIEPIEFLMILLAPAVSFVTLHMR